MRTFYPRTTYHAFTVVHDNGAPYFVSNKTGKRYTIREWSIRDEAQYVALSDEVNKKRTPFYSWHRLDELVEGVDNGSVAFSLPVNDYFLGG